MIQSLQDIFKLEDNNQFDKAFETYNKIYAKNKSNYEIWKHFYFFLWTAIEDAPSSFRDKIDLRHLLQIMFEEGKQTFANKADFNFIAGYTVSIFPYEYGNYNDFEKEGKRMLYEATRLDKSNIIYKMVYLGSITSVDNTQYQQVAIEAASKVLESFNGQGILNKYFRQVLYRSSKRIHH